MMYIAEIDLKKKKRQLIPLTRICLFGNVDGKRKNLEKNCTFAFMKLRKECNLLEMSGG